MRGGSGLQKQECRSEGRNQPTQAKEAESQNHEPQCPLGEMEVEVGFILGSKALVVFVQKENQDGGKNAIQWEFEWMLVNIATVSSVYRD